MSGWQPTYTQAILESQVVPYTSSPVLRASKDSSLLWGAECRETTHGARLFTASSLNSPWKFGKISIGLNFSTVVLELFYSFPF